MDTPYMFVFAVVVILFPFLIMASVAWMLRPWLRAFLHGAPMTVFDVIAIRLRGNRAPLLVDAYITLRHKGVSATIRDVEIFYIDNKYQIETSKDLVEMFLKNVPSA